MRNVGVRYVKPYTARHGAGTERTVRRYRDAYVPRHAAPTGGAS